MQKTCQVDCCALLWLVVFVFVELVTSRSIKCRDFRRRECSLFPIVGQHHVWHRRIHRNWTDQVARWKHRQDDASTSVDRHSSYVDSFIVEHEPRVVSFDDGNVMATIRPDAAMNNKRDKIIDAVAIRTIVALKIERTNVRVCDVRRLATVEHMPTVFSRRNSNGKTTR
jgi:hypothetical protein